MNILDLLKQANYEAVDQALRIGYPERSGEIRMNIYRSLFERLQGGKAMSCHWTVVVKPHTEDCVSFCDPDRPERGYSILNLSEAGFLGLSINDEEILEMGQSAYLAHLLVEWRQGEQFMLSDDSGCVEPNDHLPEHHN